PGRDSTTCRRPGYRSHPPARTGPASRVPAGTSESAYPAQGRISGPSGENRGVIDWHTPLGHHFFDIAVAHPVAAVPPHRPQDDVTGEMLTGEVDHDSDDFTPIFLLAHLRNCTNKRQIAVVFRRIEPRH